MRAIRPGDRGPAVEDIQRRLRALGHDIGPTGVDGVFAGRTLTAVESFQLEHGLDEDGLVGDLTWAALVDATFKLGDRTLYLRLPHFHGVDVRELQQALNTLGFAPGDVDGIFGAFTERAVREFQRNTGLPADGIVGADTVAALVNLRHVWQGKDGPLVGQDRKGPVRRTDVLARISVGLMSEDGFSAEVAGRVMNLALASTSDARIALLSDARPADPSMRAIVRLVPDAVDARPGVPTVRLDGADRDAILRLITAFEAAEAEHLPVVVTLDAPSEDPEHDAQRAAVAIIDALCTAFA